MDGPVSAFACTNFEPNLLPGQKQTLHSHHKQTATDCVKRCAV